MGLAIEYHVAPADRIALRKLMQSTGIKQFEKWKAQGIIKHYQLLFNRYVDSQNWDMMAFVTFNTFADVTRWKGIEEHTPAGLPHAALKLTKSIHTNPADLYFQGGTFATRPSSAKSVFLVIPYDYTVSTAEYVKYSEGYIVPQFDGWLDEGVIASYGIYLGRYAVDRHWSALLVLEYKDDAALGLRERTIAKVRSRLRENPAWKAISDNKQNVRVGRSYIMADPLLP
jgi:DNA-binding Lrp family transcriptional regulator